MASRAPTAALEGLDISDGIEAGSDGAKRTAARRSSGDGHCADGNGGAPSSTAALAPSQLPGSDVRSRYQAAIDARLEQLARLPSDAERRREVGHERLRQRIEAILINEAFEEDETGRSAGMTDLLRSIAARKQAARKALK